MLCKFNIGEYMLFDIVISVAGMQCINTEALVISQRIVWRVSLHPHVKNEPPDITLVTWASYSNDYNDVNLFQELFVKYSL